ncbi:hypothetical protein KYK29_17660 [Shinella daejeonensis]|uniref:hypothetical protein n=1 Tax=Shinella daejeonensis TaxID=659017 RepID=UPI0020C78C9B|nr:hypothetical protein [Shinella daejeonensis]MCP8896756.1 hypothetical protein [Shinella daejeonensis]
MIIRISLFATLAFSLLIASLPAGAAEILPDPVAREKAGVAERCKQAFYGRDFVEEIDFNNDGLADVITNLGAVNCDGVPGGLCGNVGCPHNFYIRVAEGGYFLAASADLYGYTLKKRYGNKVLELRANAASCGRDDSDYCMMTIRVRGTRFETISKK